MAVEHIGYVELPRHTKPGGFDHAAVHSRDERLYVAHTANDAIDVVDCKRSQYLHSIPDLTGVAGVLVSEDRNLVFTSNRGEDTASILTPVGDAPPVKVTVGIRPKGLAYDPARNLLLVANVGDPAVPSSHTVSLVDVRARTLIGNVRVPGRTRWAVFDAQTEAFYVNIADPPQIAVFEAKSPDYIARAFPIPATGPHGMDLDPRTHRLFCACDGKALVMLNASTGRILGQGELGGGPDVIFVNVALRDLYVAIGDPGLIEVFETETMRCTLAMTAGRNYEEPMNRDMQRFLLRRLHSLTGIFPIGVFLLEHFYTSAKVQYGAEAFNQAERDLWSIPYLWAAEIFLIALPILFHGIYGFFITPEGDTFHPTHGSQTRYHALAYTLQRATGVVVFIFLL